MPELPEVEVLVRYLRPRLVGQTIKSVDVRRERVIRPTPTSVLKRNLGGAKFVSVERRGKYILFTLRTKGRNAFVLLGHLGMSGRMFVASAKVPDPKHAAVILHLGRQKFVYQDTRYFGRLTLDIRPLSGLGPEPLSDDFAVREFAQRLKRSTQPIKIRLLDQSLVAGVGNIYASEALHVAGISPRTPARNLTVAQIEMLARAIRIVLQTAIDCGSTVPLEWAGTRDGNNLFYYGSSAEGYAERLVVYDRAGLPCTRCGKRIRRITQAARSTYYCAGCQSP